MENEETAREAWFRNTRAMNWQNNSKFITSEKKAWRSYITSSMYSFKKPQVKIPLGRHPFVIQDKIKNLTPAQQGYNFWGGYEKAKYYA